MELKDLQPGTSICIKPYPVLNLNRGKDVVGIYASINCRFVDYIDTNQWNRDYIIINWKGVKYTILAEDLRFGGKWYLIEKGKNNNMFENLKIGDKINLCLIEGAKVYDYESGKEIAPKVSCQIVIVVDTWRSYLCMTKIKFKSLFDNKTYRVDCDSISSWSNDLVKETKGYTGTPSLNETLKQMKTAQLDHLYPVSKQFIVQAHAAACKDWKEKIEKEFPQVFPPKPTYKVGQILEAGPVKIQILAHGNGQIVLLNAHSSIIVKPDWHYGESYAVKEMQSITEQELNVFPIFRDFKVEQEKIKQAIS